MTSERVQQRTIQLDCPYGSWRLEDGSGCVLTIPNGIIGVERPDGMVAFFDGRVSLRVPMQWRRQADA